MNNSVRPTRYSKFFDIRPQTRREIVAEASVLLFVKQEPLIQIG